MTDHGAVERLDADEASAKAGNLLGAFVDDLLGQIGGQRAHGEVRESAFPEYSVRKIGIVTDIGHGALHDGITGSHFAGKGRVLFKGVVLIHEGGKLTHTLEEAGDNRGHIGGLFDEALGKDAILSHEEEALDRVGTLGVYRGIAFFNLCTELLCAVFVVEQCALQLSQLFNHLGGEL